MLHKLAHYYTDDNALMAWGGSLVLGCINFLVSNEIVHGITSYGAAFAALATALIGVYRMIVGARIDTLNEKLKELELKQKQHDYDESIENDVKDETV